MPKKPPIEIELPDDADPLVKQTLRVLKPGNRDAQGFLISENRNRLDLRVTAGLLKRALLLVGSMIAAVRSRGWSINVDKSRASEVQHEMEQAYPMVVTVWGETMRVRIRESVKRTVHVPTPAEQMEIKRHPYFNDVPRFDFHSIDRLRMYIVSAAGDEQIADGVGARLEEQLERFMEILDRRAQRDKRAREEHERWEREQEREDELERQREAREAARQRRREALYKEAKAWAQYQRIITYLDAVRKDAAHKGDNEKLNKWLKWAQKYAESINPLRRRVR